MMQCGALELTAAPSTTAFSSDDDRWQAVVERDRRADGTFFYSVETTGIYCRPGCGARRANRDNVRFHESCGAAEAAGYRACKRCRPGESDRQVAIAAAACRILAEAESPPALAMLAERFGLSAFHFHRLFKAATGLTPKAYGDAARARRLRGVLTAAPTVTEAIYDVGFNSSGRFYEAASGMLGMTPKRFRDGGRGETLRFATGLSSLGQVLVAATEKGVAAIELGDSAEDLVHALKERFPEAKLVEGDAAFLRQVADIVAFVEEPRLGLDLPLDLRGTVFQHRVWQALRDIPVGKTASYADIAARIGAPTASRAVARACAANSVAVAVPCHRVVRKNAELAGYRWGVARKRALLDRETQ